MSACGRTGSTAPSLGRPRSWPSAGRRLWSATCSMVSTFTEIARGVPAMSRSPLIKRLKELERSGVVVKTVMAHTN